MKNVAIIIPNLKGGGAERAASSLTKNLDKKKFNVFLVLFDSSNIKYEFEGELIDLNIRASNTFFRKIFNLARRILEVYKFKREKGIDTTISFLPGPNIVNILTRRKDKIIVSVRANVTRKSNSIYSKIFDRIMWLTYNKSDYVTVVSKAIKDDLIKFFHIEDKKIVVINNSYDIEKIVELSKERIPDDEKVYFSGFNLISVGRLENSKGHFHLIRAVKHVIDKGYKVQLNIIGEGSLYDYLQDLITGYEMQDYVNILGFKNNPYKYIYNSDIFVLPSVSEGFPNVLVEAMICGKPVIASNCKTGPKEILLPDNDDVEINNGVALAEAGILVPACDGVQYNCSDSLRKEEKYLSDAIMTLFDDRDLSTVYGQKSINYSRSYHFNSIIKLWEEII